MAKTSLRILFLVLLYFFSFKLSFAQTPISGIINSYAEIVAVDTFQNSVTVSNASTFSVGDRVLLIQMQGASIDQTQTATFGLITSYENAGNYEFQTICSKQSNTLYFTRSILHAYTPGEGLQLIRVPHYQNALISGSDLTALPWNGTMGGVLVLEAETLDFGTQNINVSGMGFRGGTAELSGANCAFLSDPSYYTDFSNPDAKALKGEGIAQPIFGKECGRGPQANGGGGGNNHNAGGSGGGNYSSGGAGGQRVKESAFLCGSVTGTNTIPLVDGYNLQKIFLGGGGGAGHGNNAGIIGESGLAGGGIVILKVNTLLGSNGSILAHGQNSLVNANGDGAGGGGAGGTVLLDVQNVQSPLEVNVSGSNGINTDNGGSSNCNGPGGGGSGGVIWPSSATLSPQITATVSGGLSGTIATTSQSNCTVGGTNGAQNGTDGVVKTNLLLPQGNLAHAKATISASACNQYISPSGLFTWDSSGVYYDTVQNALGCDSVITINLSINQVDTTVFQSAIELISAVIGAQYQWLDCENNYALLPGETNQSFTASANGFYALEITQNGCTDTSSCHQVTNVGIIDHSFGGNFRVFPNPSTGSVTIDFGRNQSQITYALYSVSGALIFRNYLDNTAQIKMDLPADKGMYLLQVETASGKYAVVKVVRQ